MAKLKNFNGHYCESEYEYAFIAMLEAEGWQYLSGNKLVRTDDSEVLYVDDLQEFLCRTNDELMNEEVNQIVDSVRLVGSDSDFKTLHKVYNWLVNGFQFVPQNGLPQMVELIDFENPKNNIFRVVNQFTIDYVNNGVKKDRRPDVLLYINVY